jgi:hypothetical protein
MRNLLLADAGSNDVDRYWLLGGLLVAVAVLVFAGGYLIVRVRRWRSLPSLTLDQEIAWYKKLYTEGELSPDEYRRIMASLTARRRSDSSSPPNT